ncbi:hypothetical protein NE237_020165 [Protea cynaroides]|uniref:Uncharacterized protein n=1 Tax=Protea cynaroides TaxID=273540 RepID=A0A9Q0H6Q4_9MAGN|nr:hypothetical protein NE237_020165 [Protea cynaroides]
MCSNSRHSSLSSSPDPLFHLFFGRGTICPALKASIDLANVSGRVRCPTSWDLARFDALWFRYLRPWIFLNALGSRAGHGILLCWDRFQSLGIRSLVSLSYCHICPVPEGDACMEIFVRLDHN